MIDSLFGDHSYTVKLGGKEKIGAKDIASLLHKDKEHLELRNNFRVTKKLIIPKCDCHSG